MNCSQFFRGLCAALALAGCNGGQSSRENGWVSGSVSLTGKPLTQGVVIFEDAGRGISSSAVVQDGKFKFARPIEPGDFKVAIKPPPDPAPHEMPATPEVSPIKIPAQFLNPEKSGLTANVQSGKNEFDFKIE